MPYVICYTAICVCCMLYAICDMRCAICYMHYAINFMLYCNMLSAVCSMLYRCMIYAIWCLGSLSFLLYSSHVCQLVTYLNVLELVNTGLSVHHCRDSVRTNKISLVQFVEVKQKLISFISFLLLCLNITKYDHHNNDNLSCLD